MYIFFQPNRNIPSSPYVIGLTGGIASGKSALCGRLEKLGAGIVDCDKLGNVNINGYSVSLNRLFWLIKGIEQKGCICPV